MLRAICAYKGHPVTQAAPAFAPPVCQRPGDLRQAEWVEFDLGGGSWTIPSDRMKRTKQGKAIGPDPLVPLSVQAVAILRDLQPLTDADQDVLPSLRTKDRPMSDAAVTGTRTGCAMAA